MKKKLVIVCAPSGAGKTTIVRYLLEHIPDIEFSVSATNRPKRDYETDGHDYYFISTDAFREKISQNAFLEWEEVYPGRFYGTLRSEVDRIWEKGNHVIFDVDVVGAQNIKNQYGRQALLMFIKPPSAEHLRKRLENRGSENKESLEVRLQKADREMEYESGADYVLVNDILETAQREAIETVQSFLQKPA